MSPFRPAALVLLLSLAACTQTSNPNCNQPETRELRTVDRLIADTTAVIQRGYRTEEVQGNASVNVCLGSGGANVGVSFCADPTRRSVPVAIDLAAEQRKLAGLEARRSALLDTIRTKQALCATNGAL